MQVSNYQDQYNVQYCDLVGLPDLCTGCEKVQQTVSQYLSMLHALDVTGVRMDAAKHMNPSELGEPAVATGVPYGALVL